MKQSKLIAAMLASLLVAVPAYAQEASGDAVLPGPADERVYLEADRLIDNREDGVLIAEGNVQVKYGIRELRADRVIYTIETQKVRAIGNVRIADPDGTMRFAEELEVDEQLADGVATQFVAQLPGDALVIARAASRSADGSNTLDQAIYTACEICEDGEESPTWALRARRAKQNAETQMITYQDAVLEVKGVPVLYVPYFAHPDPSSKRRSGLLAPEPGLSSKLGAFYIQPYYLALSKSQDLTIIPHLHTNVAPLLELEYRKRFYSGYVEVETSLVYDEQFELRRGPPLVRPERLCGPRPVNSDWAAPRERRIAAQPHLR